MSLVTTNYLAKHVREHSTIVTEGKCGKFSSKILLEAPKIKLCEGTPLKTGMKKIYRTLQPLKCESTYIFIYYIKENTLTVVWSLELVLILRSWVCK